jgi:pimeloyl-ACP methyl ester carboxylesterase
MAALGAVALSLSAAAGAAGQSVPATFLHGLASAGSTWTHTSDSLAGVYTIVASRPTIGRGAICGHVPTLGGFTSLPDQAAELNQLITQSGTILVAHSAGGLVGRWYIGPQFGGPQRVNRLLTVGTPHRGAPLAQRVLRGHPPDTAGQLRRLDDMYGIMSDMLPPMTTRNVNIAPLFQSFWWPVLAAIRSAILDAATDPKFWMPFCAPMTSELLPYSPHVATLRAQAESGVEAYVNRAAIRGQTTQEGLMFKAFLPLLYPNATGPELRAQVADFEYLRRTLRDAMLGVALTYSATQVAWYLRNGLPPCLTDPINTYRIMTCKDEVNDLLYLLGAVYVLDQLHPLWRRAIGAPGGDNTSDAVVPDSSQIYPSLPPALNYVLVDGWHGLETREAGGLISNVMNALWSVPQRILPLTDLITKNGYTYTANPAGGQTPYGYLWEVLAVPCEPENVVAADGRGGPGGQGGIKPQSVVCGWQAVGSSSAIYWTLPHRTLRSTVTDARGSTAVAEYQVP